MKKLFLIIIGLCLMPIVVMASDYEEAGFESENFYKCVLKTLKTTERPSDEQLASITRVDCINTEIESTKGIEKLSSLTMLTLKNNGITNLDLSGNPILRELIVQNNNISNIDLSNNRNLIYIFLDHNDLSSIDLTNNLQVAQLDLSYNVLESINLSLNSQISKLDLSNNLLTSIDLSNNPNISWLDLSNNRFGNLDLTNNTHMDTLNLMDNILTSLNLTNLRSLKYLYLTNNKITSLDLSNQSGLVELDVSGNNIESMIISNSVRLQTMQIDYNILKDLDLTANTELREIYVYHHDIVSLTNEDVLVEKVLEYLPEEIKSQDYELIMGDGNRRMSKRSASPEVIDHVSVSASNVSFSNVNPVTLINYSGYFSLSYMESPAAETNQVDASTINHEDSLIVKTANRVEEDKNEEISNDIVSSPGKANPETGSFIPLISISIIALLGLLIFIKTGKRKTIFLCK